MFNDEPWVIPQDATRVDECADGGYPFYYVVDSYVAICPECVNENIALCKDETNKEWFVTNREVNWEDPSLYCDHCSKRIESAYAEDECDNNSEPDDDSSWADANALASAGFGMDEDYVGWDGGDD